MINEIIQSSYIIIVYNNRNYYKHAYNRRCYAKNRLGVKSIRGFFSSAIVGTFGRIKNNYILIITIDRT